MCRVRKAVTHGGEPVGLAADSWRLRWDCTMGYEIDFLPVGRQSKSGDAITLRYGDLFGDRDSQTVIVIDAGFDDDGDQVVEHLARYYRTDEIDVLISTHPDQDHIGGLKAVLGNLKVRTLWLHRPWNHSSALMLAKSVRFREPQLPERLQKSLDDASELETMARARGVHVVEPFVGTSTADGVLRVVGPTREFYRQLQGEISTGASATADAVVKADERTIPVLAAENLMTETLTDDGDTSPQNESSVICLLTVENDLCLFTADAGMRALELAAAQLEGMGYWGGIYNFVQVPHHGSRHNVGPTVLDRLLGEFRTENRVGVAFVSAAKDGAPNHPARAVTNAFRRRGYHAFATQGVSIQQCSGAPDRPGWGPATVLPLHSAVEKS